MWRLSRVLLAVILAGIVALPSSGFAAYCLAKEALCQVEKPDSCCCPAEQKSEEDCCILLPRPFTASENTVFLVANLGIALFLPTETVLPEVSRESAEIELPRAIPDPPPPTRSTRLAMLRKRLI